MQQDCGHFLGEYMPLFFGDVRRQRLMVLTIGTGCDHPPSHFDLVHVLCHGDVLAAQTGCCRPLMFLHGRQACWLSATDVFVSSKGLWSFLFACCHCCYLHAVYQISRDSWRGICYTGGMLSSDQSATHLAEFLTWM